MATVIIMPKQGQSVESCILTELKKKKGDAVAVGDILFAYETDKASFEESAEVAGIVLDVFYAEGDEIPVLTNVMVIGEEGESTEGYNPHSGVEETVVEENDKSVVVSKPEQKCEELSTTPAVQIKETGTSPVSPRAKALADKEAIDASSLVGSGPKGRVIERDVEAAVKATPKKTPLAKEIAKVGGMVAPATGSGLAGMVRGSDMEPMANVVYGGDSEVKPLSNMRKLIANAMYTSLQSSAQLTHHLSADARQILAMRQKVKKAMANGYPTNITLNDMVCMATINALKKHPRANAHFLSIKEGVRYFNKVHLGLAVDTERGLMVPAIRNADDLSIAGLANQMGELARGCREGGVNPDLLLSEAATFTVSNLGSYGVEMFTPIINLPQVAILGVNTIVPRPKDMGGGVYGFVPHIGLSLTYDHRALDGGEATLFLKQIATEIETIEFDVE